MGGTADSGEVSSSQSQESQLDTVLNIQYASSIVNSIYFDFYSLSKVDFIKNVRDLRNEVELTTFVRDMITAIV